MPRRQVLIVEDDAPIARGLQDILEIEGFEARWACTLKAAEAALLDDPDLVVLDLGLPDGDGAAWLNALRPQLPQLPVIVSSARDQLAQRVEALESGADDYLVKPYALEEFVARVRAVCRRSCDRPLLESRFVLGTLTVDLDALRLESPGREATRLTALEGRLLGHLLARRGQVVSREELLARVWQIDARAVRTRTVDMHVARLREKLAGHGADGLVDTIRGRGYRVPGEDGS